MTATGPASDLPRETEFSRETLARQVAHFYGYARADALLGPVFTARIPDDHWQAHLDKITDFWSDLILKTESYTGRPFPPHTTLPGLSPEHFSRWLALFRKTAQEIFAPDLADYLAGRAEQIGQGFQMALFFRPARQSAPISPS